MPVQVLNADRHTSHPPYLVYTSLREALQNGWRVYWDASTHLELQKDYPHPQSGLLQIQVGIWYKEPTHG